MLNDTLSKNEKSELIGDKYRRALSGFANIVNEIHKKKQFPFAKQLKDSGFSRIECKDLGFEFGKILWSNCDNPVKRNLGLHSSSKIIMK